MKTALTIAGSDPGGGAGLQADLRVFKSFGLHGFSVPAALTAQNTAGISAIYPVEPGFLRAELETLLSDARPDALKTGMLWSKNAIHAVAEAVRKYSLKNLVVDPVSVSSSGTPLMETSVPPYMEAIKELFGLARVITPNVYEAAALTGMIVEDPHGMERAAAALMETGTEAVIITGGHLAGVAVDVLYDGRKMYRLSGKKIPGAFHGTGCVFSAAVTALLALGADVRKAAGGAREFTEKAIKGAYKTGKGMRVLNI